MCSSDLRTIPPYVENPLRKRGSSEVSSLASIHQPMGITVAVSDQFNRILIGVLLANGVSQADANAVLATLDSLQTSIVQQSPTFNGNGTFPLAPSDPGFSAPNSSPTGTIVAVVIISVLCALVLGAVAAGLFFYISGGEEVHVKHHDDYDMM